MKSIIVNGFELEKEITGECISSELQWSRNVENFHHLKNGQYSTTQTPTECFNEVWDIDGQLLNLTKYVRQIGEWVTVSKFDHQFKSIGESVEYIPTELEDGELLEAL